MPKDKDQLIDKQNLEITDSDKNEVKDGDLEIPQYKEKVDLSEDQVKLLRKEVFAHFEEFKTQREEENMEDVWDDLDAQYEGEMEDNTGQEFSLNVPITKVKVDTIERLAVKAFCESEPKFSVEARPETVRSDIADVSEKQEDFLDYLFDEDIEIRPPLRMAIHQATLKKVGWLKMIYEYRRKRRKREEHYSGEKTTDKVTGSKKNLGLDSFLQEYPGADEEGNANHKYYKRLKEGKNIDIVVDFDEVVYNNPKGYFVDINDFYVDKDVEGYVGLCNAQCTLERQRFSWWELKNMEREGDLENVDEIRFKTEKNKDGTTEEIKDFKNKKFKILEVVYWFNEKATEDTKEEDLDVADESRIVCWFSEESKVFLGAIYYPYYYVDAYYIPFNIKTNKPGIYKGGVAEDLTDSNLAQNAILNFTLTAAWIQNTITPIVREGSEIAQQFIEKRWTHGVPLEISNEAPSLRADLDFLETTQMNSGEMINILLFLGKMDDDQTGISSLKTGRESPQDPSAPASKVALLLRETGINIEDYVNSLLPSFNLIGEIAINLIHQMSRSGRLYKQRKRANAITGRVGPDKKDIFETITPDELRAKTVIRSQAAGFSFDKDKEKSDNLALYQVLRGEPAVVQNPNAIYELIRNLIKSWSPLWRAKADEIWKTPEQFQEDQIKTAAVALELYLEQIKRQEEVTGVKPEVNIQDFLQLAQQMQIAQLTPPQEEKK